MPRNVEVIPSVEIRTPFQEDASSAMEKVAAMLDHRQVKMQY